MAMTDRTMARNSGQFEKKVVRMPGRMVSAIIVPMRACAQRKAGRGRRMVPPFMPTTAPATIGPIKRAAGMPVSSSAPARTAEMTSRNPHCMGTDQRPMPDATGADGSSEGSGVTWGTFKSSRGGAWEAGLGTSLTMRCGIGICARCGGFLRYLALLSENLMRTVRPRAADRCSRRDRQPRIGQ